MSRLEEIKKKNMEKRNIEAVNNILDLLTKCNKVSVFDCQGLGYNVYEYMFVEDEKLYSITSNKINDNYVYWITIYKIEFTKDIKVPYYSKQYINEIPKKYEKYKKILDDAREDYEKNK